MFDRSRRLRKNNAIRELIRETVLTSNDFIFPFFVVEGKNIKKEIESLPGNYHYSIDKLPELIYEIQTLGVKGVLIFGVPLYKDEIGSSAFDTDGIVQRAVKKIKEIAPELWVITDVCMCQFTNHGHCGILCDNDIDNDKTIEYIAKIALSHAEAGADMVAPSDMMDGRVQRIRSVLDDKGYKNISIMSYSAKYSSAFYGPFREAAGSAPKSGDRKSYQMEPGNIREALREIDADIKEGADIIMVKPALSYLDVIKSVRERCNIPIAAYSVSGEYAMIKAGAKLGFIDEKAIALETLLSIKRAGADLIITYYALEAAKWLSR